MMESIFHEKQEGQLCAQHCLNNLLQGPYFTAVDLSKLARELDEAEQVTMSEGEEGFHSPEFLNFLQQPSANMDDTGYFSVQVISKALSVWSLSLEPLSSPNMKIAMDSPTFQTAYICNHEHHWLTIRKLGKQWFNLNSIQRRPELISDTYLKLFLTQLQLEGYSIFVVTGSLPMCEADQLLSLIPLQPSDHASKVKVQSSDHTSSKVKGRSPVENQAEEDYEIDLAMAMSASMASSSQQSSSAAPERDSASSTEQKTADEPLTIEPLTIEPLTVEPLTVEPLTIEPLTVEQLRERRLKHFERLNS